MAVSQGNNHNVELRNIYVSGVHFLSSGGIIQMAMT